MWPYLCIEGVLLLKKTYRLRKNKDFKRVYEGKFSIPSGTLVLYVLKTERAGAPRIGISVSKRVGNSVLRNRVRRRLREAVRPYIGTLPEGTDFVIVGRSRIAAASFSQIQKDLSRVLHRSGILGK